MSGWCNYHTHSTFCDGKATVTEVLDAGNKQGLIALGFSSHAPLPFHRSWSMKPEVFASYREEIAKLKLSGPLPEVYCGLEVDYIPGKIGPGDFAAQLDYTIGSIHFVESFADGSGWEIDGPHLHFREGFEKIFKKDIRAVLSRYFELTREMLVKSPPTILGHLDKIKIQNAYHPYFEETETWYREEILKTIREIKNSGCLVEVNTRGLYQKKSTTPYPSPWILEELCRQGIPVTLSSDAHHPADLCNQFPEVAGLLRKIGFKKICILAGGRWQDVTFDEHGINPG